MEQREVGNAVVVIGTDAAEVGDHVRRLEHEGRRVLAFVGDGDDPTLNELIDELSGVVRRIGNHES